MHFLAAAAMDVLVLKPFAIIIPKNLNLSMISVCLYILVFNSVLKDVNGQTSTNLDPLSSSETETTNFQPTLAVVIGILSIMFSLTFFLLLYAKFCHRSPTATVINNRLQIQDGLLRSRSRFSGIDKTIIESLPFFKFSSLKGSKEGLDCAICLSKFEDIEILRLLPKCKHAFHINCLDEWLEKHSSCPLCRNKISGDDLSTLTYSNSLRFLLNDEDDSNNNTIELYVQREESKRFTKQEEEEEEELPIKHQKEEEFDKLNHKIIVSGGCLLKHRWSNLSSADLMFLKSEMLLEMSSERFSSSALDSNTENNGIFDIKQEMERKREFENKFKKIKQNDSIFLPDENITEDSKGILNEKRSMSEIVVHSRLQENNNNNLEEEEERVRRIWLPIARRTVQWFVNRETKSTQAGGEAEYIRQTTLNV